MNNSVNSISKLLNTINNTLNIANKAIPIYQQAKPILKNVNKTYKILKNNKNEFQNLIKIKNTINKETKNKISNEYTKKHTKIYENMNNPKFFI